MAGHSFAAVSLAVGYRSSDVGLPLSDLAPAAGLADGAFDEVRWAAVPHVSKHAPPGAARPAARLCPRSAASAGGPGRRPRSCTARRAGTPGDRRSPGRPRIRGNPARHGWPPRSSAAVVPPSSRAPRSPHIVRRRLTRSPPSCAISSKWVGKDATNRVSRPVYVPPCVPDITARFLCGLNFLEFSLGELRRTPLNGSPTSGNAPSKTFRLCEVCTLGSLPSVSKARKPRARVLLISGICNDGQLKHELQGAYPVPLSRKPNKSAIATTVRAGGREKIPYYVRGDGPGVYLLVFTVPTPQEEQEAAKKLGVRFPTNWAGRECVEVKRPDADKSSRIWNPLNLRQSGRNRSHG